MKRRNAIKKMIVGIAALLGLKIAPTFETKCRKTAIGEIYTVEFSPEQYNDAKALITSLSSDLYARKLKSYSAKFGSEGHCVVEWSPNMYV